jgi:hypothetical protein
MSMQTLDVATILKEIEDQEALLDPDDVQGHIWFSRFRELIIKLTIAPPNDTFPRQIRNPLY